MNKIFNFKVKSNNGRNVALFVSLIFVSISGILTTKMYRNKISKVESYDNKFANVKVASGSQVITINKNEDNCNINSGKNILYANKNIVRLKTEDTARPDNIDTIETKVIEDTMLISFHRPKDNGTSYSYLIKNNKKNTKEKNYNFYSESGIKGYCYEINNNCENVVQPNLNKLDDTPLVIQQLDWDKNYYLHIKTIDNNGNESDCKTIKLQLPSKGLKIKYIDLNTNQELCNSYNMDGNVNDKYNISDKIKDIQGYKLVAKKGEINGELKRNQINIEAIYAKVKNLTIKYFDEETNKEIKEPYKLECYIGQNVEINIPTIAGYQSKSKKTNCKVSDSENVIKLYYKKIKLPESDKNIQVEKDKDITKEEKRIAQDRNIRIKYVDFDTNKILFEETKTVKPDEKKIKLKMYYIEGYSKMSNEKNEYNNHSEEEKTIMDELRESIVGKENAENETHQDENNLIDNIPSKQEYEILMNCDQSDYIIYYKKQ